ncbi:MAG TPA: cbb3-type cytochrome c oxidase subunit II [Candidatus Sumerlaeota bacterium]|nr:MAG: Cytochrome C oxidase, mono-heme subunit/FixO [candidate division BRC1 bacterium ADurb.BinA292]HOR27877.1 cbb3-type cytochrome c oxidase subunit II [Candidatus Sumerlaeota bacterium]HPK01974.1 cbb3-type cytochrome c oxidase subunit II [Candidatus Sumerlaeota bacterium]
MNRTALLYAGIIFTVIISSIGLVFIPEYQLFRLEPVEAADGNLYPQPRTEFEEAGRRVYIAMGCVYCHSQQVRPEHFGADIDRGWGTRRSVARDYLYDQPHQLGTMRTGPDLVNIGSRQSDDNWHYQHLYDPELTSPGSTMPKFPFLFEKRTLEPGREPPFNAIRMPPGVLAENEYLLPTTDAQQLVAYLKSMRHDYAVPEAQP